MKKSAPEIFASHDRWIESRPVEAARILAFRTPGGR